MPKENIYNVPNALTLLRIVLLAPAIILIHRGLAVAALSVYAAILLTDVLDGFFARRLNQVTDFGEYFDFVSDFIGYYAFLIYFFVVGRLTLTNSVLLCVATIALFWIAVSLSRKAGRLYMPHRTSSKAMAVLLSVAFIIFIIRTAYDNMVLLVALAFSLVYTVPDYLWYCAKYRSRKKK